MDVTIQDRECPTCGEWSCWKENQTALDCDGCEHTLALDPDGEFVDGVWHDRTLVIDETERHQRQITALMKWSK